jgi:hypothetical protein
VNTIIAVLIPGALIVSTISALVWFILASPLRKILGELYETDGRIAFWIRFSQLNLFLVPVVFSTFGVPSLFDARQSLVLQILVVVRWGAFGLVLSLAALGLTLKKIVSKNGR